MSYADLAKSAWNWHGKVSNSDCPTPSFQTHLKSFLDFFLRVPSFSGALPSGKTRCYETGHGLKEDPRIFSINRI